MENGPGSSVYADSKSLPVSAAVAEHAHLGNDANDIWWPMDCITFARSGKLLTQNGVRADSACANTIQKWVDTLDGGNPVYFDGETVVFLKCT